MSSERKSTEKPRPAKLQEKDRPLSDSDLDQVSGGAEPISERKRPPKPAEPTNN
jgi:hypothetical protein